MAEIIFKSNFFKDYVWIWLIFAILFGLPTLVFSIGWMIYVLMHMKGVVMLVMILVSLSLAVLAWSFFFAFSCALKQEVVFSPSYIEVASPPYALFWAKKIRIQKKDIQAVALGFVAMRKIFPEEMKSKTMSMIPRDLFIKIGHIQDGRMRSILLPNFNNQQYFSELKKLVKDTRLKKTELAFIFKK